MSLLSVNDKHSTTDEQIRGMQVELEALRLEIESALHNKDTNLQHHRDMQKVQVDKEKVRKMNKEHVSDN
jgi:hypothetical protein